ncbi:SH3-like domain-containing protein [Geminicoccus roseus]|uniref:SH3-like domain-containing protein n=1 Tax=Geminicoccus roseus TaxID=404900 RepID=UPI00041F8FB3|nr:SH3-like domain-containing protein [Geminicoccus roseus]
MNGVHDLGGLHGFGPVVRENDEPVFHADWERTTFGLLEMLAFEGHCNIDEARHAIERMGPSYLTTSYYEHWLAAIETLCVEKGLFTPEELDRTVAALQAKG